MRLCQAFDPVRLHGCRNRRSYKHRYTRRAVRGHVDAVVIRSAIACVVRCVARSIRASARTATDQFKYETRLKPASVCVLLTIRASDGHVERRVDREVVVVACL